MTTVVIDAATCEKLLAVDDGEVQLLSEAGKVLGLFTRSDPAGDDLLDTPFTDEEIERHLREGRAVPADEFLAHLRSLTRCK